MRDLKKRNSKMQINQIDIDTAKTAMKKQIDDIGINDGVSFLTFFDKFPGEEQFMKGFKITIDKDVKDDES